MTKKKVEQPTGPTPETHGGLYVDGVRVEWTERAKWQRKAEPEAEPKVEEKEDV